MKPLPPHYDVHLSGGPSGYAQLTTTGVPLLRTAPPADYDGPGDAWSPEHLLLAAVQACFLFTLRAIARASKVEFTRLELDAGRNCGPESRSDTLHGRITQTGDRRVGWRRQCRPSPSAPPGRALRERVRNGSARC